MIPHATLTVVPLEPAHWPQVAEIYEAGIRTGVATFESATPSWSAFDAGHLPDHRLVALGPESGPAPEVLGWAAVSRVSPRSAYAGVVEHSLYVAPQARGRGVGRALLEALITSTEAAGIWTLQAAVFPQNAASLALHRSAGFREIGVRERVARVRTGPLAGRWQDIVLLERRSRTVGT